MFKMGWVWVKVGKVFIGDNGKEVIIGVVFVLKR